MRRKKRGVPPIGPLKVGDDIVTDPQAMSEMFVQSFSSMFIPSVPEEIEAHQQCDTMMLPLRLSINQQREWKYE